jgi:hypothetical protein
MAGSTPSKRKESSTSSANKSARNGEAKDMKPEEDTKVASASSEQAKIVTPEKAASKSYKHYVIVIQGQSNTDSITLNSFDEVEKFKNTYPDMLKTWKGFNTIEEAEQWANQQKHEPVTKKHENSEKMNAYIRASTDNRGENTYEVDLFYDVFAKHVVMRFVLLNTKGNAFLVPQTVESGAGDQQLLASFWF